MVESGSLKEYVVNNIIGLIKEMELDGETVQDILEQTGMDEQMYKQLSVKYSSVDELPTQSEVNEFFHKTQNEIHYLNSKPVEGQQKTLNLVEIEPWDEYDLANWNNLVRKGGRGSGY